jgi:prolyl-tRNA synthetase
MRGVPIRIELGGNDMTARQCVLARRDFDSKEAGAKTPVPWSNLAATVLGLLDVSISTSLAPIIVVTDPMSTLMK